MTKKITSENFIKAEKEAFERNIPIRRALRKYSSREGELELLNAYKVMSLVKPRPHNSHKGDFGRLVIIAGSDLYPGALQLAALSALRCGAGIVTVVTTERAAVCLSASIREATVFTMPSQDGFMDPNGCESKLTELIKNASAVLIGCGLGQSENTCKILELTLSEAECPVILDADGINLASTCIECVRKAKALIMTPHPGELARLAGLIRADAVKNRCEVAENVRRITGGVLVSKSSATLILDGKSCMVSARGNSGLARGGSGDMLAGMIASFAAQGYKPSEAAIIGVTVEGLACERACKKTGERGVLPSDIIASLPGLFKTYGV